MCRAHGIDGLLDNVVVDQAALLRALQSDMRHSASVNSKARLSAFKRGN